MIATLVHVHVKPEHIKDFVEATKINHQNSIKEPGNLRFDVLQNKTDPNLFTLYEAYESEEAFALHKETAHCGAWRIAVEPMMAEPRKGIRHEILFPVEKSAWKL